MGATMIDHTTVAFDVDLRALSEKVKEMGSLNERQLRDAVKALEMRDLALARQVIATDDQVDVLQREIEQKAVVTIARRQPMAVDLREIVGALRTCGDLERVGDHAENIAKRTLLLSEESRINEVMLHVQRMARLVLDQLSAVLLSYERRDVDEAMRVWRKDYEVDTFNNALVRKLLTFMMEDPRNITFCMHLLFCAKNLERIGDHATNIAETVYYIVKGSSLLERPKADITSTPTLPLST